jgi:hypothetical protein
MLKRANKPFDFGGDFAAIMLSAEIRSHFASLPSTERLANLNAAIESGDVVTLKAIFTGLSYLSGIPPQLHEHTRNALIDRDPDAKSARDGLVALEEQQTFAQLLQDTVLHSTADVIDFASADIYEAAAV